MTIQKHHLIEVMTEGNFTTALVKFPATERTYTYKVRPAMLQQGLEEGAHVIVPNAQGGGYQCATVVEVHHGSQLDYEACFYYKWIVDVVNDSAHVRQLECEAEFLKALEEKKKSDEREKFRQDFMSDVERNTVGHGAFVQALSQLRSPTTGAAPAPAGWETRANPWPDVCVPMTDD